MVPNKYFLKKKKKTLHDYLGNFNHLLDHLDPGYQGAFSADDRGHPETDQVESIHKFDEGLADGVQGVEIRVGPELHRELLGLDGLKQFTLNQCQLLSKLPGRKLQDREEDRIFCCRKRKKERRKGRKETGGDSEPGRKKRKKREDDYKRQLISDAGRSSRGGVEFVLPSQSGVR